MSETVDALRETWACKCGAEDRAKQVYVEARRVAIARVGGEDLTDSDGRYLFVDVLFAGGFGRTCSVCVNIPWRLQPEASFTLTRRNERALACLCGGGGERAKQDLKQAQDAHENETGRSGIPPHAPGCPKPPVGCNAACWYIQPGVEAIVPNISLAPITEECVVCGGEGKVAVRSPTPVGHVGNVRKLLVILEGREEG